MKKTLIVALTVLSASFANAQTQIPKSVSAAANAAGSCLAGQVSVDDKDQLVVCGKDGKWVVVNSINGDNAPAVVYSLSGETTQPWAPEGVWADETGVHVRLKSTAPTQVPMIYAQNDDGTLSVVGLRFWPVGIIDAETHAKHVVFRYGSGEVSAAAIQH